MITLETSSGWSDADSQAVRNDASFDHSDYTGQMTEDLCRKEHDQMKMQISEMVGVIAELKAGLEKFTRSHAIIIHNSKEKGTPVSQAHLPSLMLNHKFEEKRSQSDSNLYIDDELVKDSSFSEIPNEESSQLTGLTLLQKLIDENDQLDEEEDCLDEDSLDNMNDLEELEKGLGIGKKKYHEIQLDNSTAGWNTNSIDSKLKKNDRFDSAVSTPFMCPICKAPLKDGNDFDQHYKIHYTKGTYDCALCNQKFTGQNTFINHFVCCFKKLKAERSLKDQACEICGDFYADPTSLIHHKSFHSKCRHFPCPKCSLRYYDKITLEVHIKNQHNPSSKHVCPICNRSFNYHSTLFTHIAVHSGARPFRCNICSDYKADNKRAITLHIHKHGGFISRRYSCKECFQIFETKHRLFKHKLREHREPMRCSECGKKFNYLSGYKRHFEIHLNKGMLKCSKCLYSTHITRYLKRHILTHNISSTSVNCPECKTTLTNRGNVPNHLRNYCKKLIRPKK